jgi:uncharacterized membrane protein
MFMRKTAVHRFFVLVVLVALAVVFAGWTSMAAETKKKEDLESRPERSIQMSAEFPGVEVPPGQTVTMNLIFDNKGRTNENVSVAVASKPAGWRVRLKTDQYTIIGISVPWGEQKTVTFEAEPDKSVKPGDYAFDIQAKTTDGQFQMAQTILVKAREREKGSAETRGVRLTTSYPVLRGPSDASFEFSVEVESKLDRDAVFDLFAQAPEGWEINFKPAYETKYITGLRLKGNSSQTVAIQVKPAMNMKAGEYPINMRVSSGDARAEAKLMVVLTGTYAMDAGTPTGLLTLEGRQGKPATASIFVKNTGSAPLQEVKFMSFKPENWKVEFKPEKLPALEPNELKQVEVTITPYEEALVGDYSVGLGISTEKASKNLEFRVTVKASSAWGWVGIGIIVLVVLGLTGLFQWLGRR